MGLTLGSVLLRCLASDPIRMTTDWRTESKFCVAGAESRNSSNTGSRLVAAS